MSAFGVHKTKIHVEQVQSVYDDFPVTCVCLSIVCEPPALFSCEYTLNGNHSAHITMRSEQVQPSQGNLFYAFTVY